MRKINQDSINLFRNIREKGFFHLLSANMLIQFVAFASQLFVAGILASDDIGRIKVIQTYLSVFLILAGMGFNASTLKLCSENRSLDEQNTLFRSALLFTIISSISTYIIVLVLNSLSIFSSDTLIKWLIPIGLFPIISNSIFMVFVSYFQASKRIKLLSKITISNKLISIVAIIVFTYWLGIKGYYIAYNLSFLLMLIVCIKIYGSEINYKLFYFSKLSQFKLHWHYAKTSMFAYLLSEISAYVDIILLTVFINDMYQIGHYSFALTLTVIIRLFPSTVQQITVPYFSSLSHIKEEFEVAFKRYNKILYAIIFITLVVLVLITPTLVNLVFKGKFDESMNFFPYLALGWSLRQLAQLQNGAIFGLGKIKYNVYTSVITLTFNVLTILILIYYYGIMGAAYASVLGGIVFNISSSYYFKKAQKEM